MRSLCARLAFLQSIRQGSHCLKASVRPICKPISQSASPAMPPKSKGAERLYKHTHSYLQVLGNGTDTSDTTPSVLLFFDSYRYVFNVGEGFQRYCFQHRLKLGKLNDVFLTRMSTEAAGGVPGLFITLSDFGVYGNSGAVDFNLHGPLKLEQFLRAIRTFVSIPVGRLGGSNFGSAETAGLLGDALVSNEQVEIRPILIMPDTASVPPSSPSPFLASQNWGSVVPVACYVCQLSESKGKFQPEAARELGVRMGPDFGKLVGGISVEAENGNIVHPHQVMEPAVPGPTVLIVDCPDHRYSSALFSAPAFTPFLEKPETEGDTVMMHLGPFEVVSGKEYQKWMRKFPAAVHHVFVNARAANSTATMRKAAVVQTKLNLVDERYFPLPKTITSQEEWQQEGVTMGKDLLRYNLKPVAKKGLDASQLLEPFDREGIVRTLQEEDPSLFTTIQSFRERREKNGHEGQKVAPNELEVAFLGTGSAVPSKYRNVTGIYLDFFERGSVMLDCGEGSYGQMIRRFGKEGAQEAIQKLRCIWISHIHADHHIGLPTVLRERRKLVDSSAPPLLVMGPPALYATMQNYEQLEPMHFIYLFINETNDTLPKHKHARLADKGSLGMFTSVKEELNLKSMDSFLVDHCAHAYGVSLVSKNGWKLVFSDATLLIHEATFEEDMKEEALLKKHSTIRDAIRIAKEANVYRTILTHFSQRYPKIPVMEADARAGICIAFDLMSVNLSDLEMLPHTLEPCQGLFKEEQGDTEEQETSSEPTVAHS